ncbi:hypothetical protein AB0C15_19530 [Micromonospora sp. NPDC048835]|uniref:hypothetical protein n=1 Tax=Micromonospora sp. NPDC048835 TaxID=3155147 RepID=UPI0033CA85E8
MNGRPVAVATSMIVIGIVGLVLGAILLASGYWPSVGLVATGILLVVLGAVLLRDTRRTARRTGRRHPPEEGNAHYASYPWPAADAGSSWHGDRQRDGGHDSSGGGGTEPVGGSVGGDSGRSWSGWGWSSGDSGGGWSGGDSGGGWSGGDSGGGWSGGDSGGGWSGGGDSGGGGGGS